MIGSLEMRRNRWLYAFLVGLVMILGLSSRRFGAMLPEFVADHAGDALWALLVFLGFGWLFARHSTWVVGGMAIGFATGIEISQMWQPPWLEAVRNTTLGGLILGHGFLWIDLVRYTAGVALGMFAEFVWFRFKGQKGAPNSKNAAVAI